MSTIHTQTLLDAMTENVAIVDETGIILWINRAWSDFYRKNGGCAETSLKGANYLSVITTAAQNNNEYAQKTAMGFENILAGKISEFELEYPCNSETQQRWFVANISEIGSGSPRNFLFTHKNVTSLVIRELNVLKAQRLEAVGQLAGGIAHDFNNLLSIIMGNLELAQLSLEKNNKIQEYLANSVSALERGGLVIQQLLSFSRQQELNFKKIELNSFIKNTLNLLKPTLGENILLSTQFEPEIFYINVDTSMLSNAILNLAINAKHAMPAGGSLIIQTAKEQLKGTVFFSHDEQAFGDYVLIDVSDTGTGISSEDLTRVFEPFFTTKDRGSGLGLSMVTGFMKQSKGFIDIDSRVGTGTSVRLYLPLDKHSGDCA